jgi:predicted RNA binding protein YcfA (HicA-like mRNA interferase family)
VKVREVIRLLEQNGWVMQPRKATNHRKFRHPNNPSFIIVSGDPGDSLAIGTLHNILKTAGLKP